MAKDRYVSFGEQIGAVPTLALALDVVPPELRNSIWNLVGPSFESRDFDRLASLNPRTFWKNMAWDKGWVIDTHRHSQEWECTAAIKRWLLQEAKWHEVYEFVQSLPRWAGDNALDVERFERSVDRMLFQHLSPYRFSDHKLVPIVSDEERAAVEQVTKLKGKYAPASEYLAKALTKFSERPTPDYGNAVKEAASALESALKIATGEKDVGNAVRVLRERHDVHVSLAESANKLFGYASDRFGVRHGKAEPGKPVDFEEAKLMIVSASAWLSFLAAKVP